MNPTNHAPSPPRRLQFGLRTLLVAVAFAAALLSWWIDHRMQLARIAELENRIVLLRGPRLLGHFPQREPELLEMKPTAFAAFGDGSKIVCAHGKSAELWEMTNGRKLLSIEHPQRVLDVAISPDEQSLLTITAGADAPARRWSLQDGELLQECASPFEADAAGASAPWPALFGDYTSPDGFGFTAVEFSPTRRRFAAGCEDGTLLVWDTATAKEIARMAGSAQRIRSMAFSPDGRKIVTSSTDFVVQLWDIAGASLLHEWRDPRNPSWHPGLTPVAFSPDGMAFAFYHGMGWEEMVRDERTGLFVRRRVAGLQTCNAETGAPVRRFRPTDGCPCVIAFSSDGAMLLSDRHSKVRLWDVASGKELLGHTCSWSRRLRFIEYLPAISAVMMVGVENSERTRREDRATIAIVPLSSFQEVPDER